MTPESTRGICRRVEDYDRGAEMLRKDPASIEGLRLVGDMKPSVHNALRVRGIQQLTDLEGFTMDQLLSWPNVGKQSAALLLQALDELKRNR